MNLHDASLPQPSAVPSQSARSTGETGLVHRVRCGDSTELLSLEGEWPSLASLKRRYIGRTIEHTGGNKTRAANLLGIDRRTLNRILARERVRKAASAG